MDVNAKDHFEKAIGFALQNVGERNVQASIHHFEEAATMGIADAYYFLGRFSTLGDGIKKMITRLLPIIKKGTT